jgi:hypothetical protein
MILCGRKEGVPCFIILFSSEMRLCSMEKKVNFRMMDLQYFWSNYFIELYIQIEKFAANKMLAGHIKRLKLDVYYKVVVPFQLNLIQKKSILRFREYGTHIIAKF